MKFSLPKQDTMGLIESHLRATYWKTHDVDRLLKRVGGVDHEDHVEVFIDDDEFAKAEWPPCAMCEDGQLGMFSIKDRFPDYDGPDDDRCCWDCLR